jgi:hypothetical protein
MKMEAMKVKMMAGLYPRMLENSSTVELAWRIGCKMFSFVTDEKAKYARALVPAKNFPA